MSLPFSIAKFLLSSLAGTRRRRFIEACKDPEGAQLLLRRRLEDACLHPFPKTPVDYNFYKGRRLTHEPVSFIETTSGSTGIKKEIPYTPLMLKAFENMFLLWGHDLVFHSDLDFKSGKFFMSISPQIGEQNSDDRKYLSPFMNLILSPFLASNPDKLRSATGEEFLSKVSSDLMKARDLEIMSVWSPTYLLSLLEFMGNPDTEKLWPDLKLISCWTSAQAERTSIKLKEKFPHVKIQPKGLLLTEAPVTVPWSEAGGEVPLLTETLIELFDGERIIPLHKAQTGRSYTVITSQFNGYLRYDTQDTVEVSGIYHKTRVLKFTGRRGNTCDLAGEKLSENILRELFFDISEDYMIIPDQSSDLPRYIILHTGTTSSIWEERLRTIHHYDLARKLQQLREPLILRVDKLSAKYLEFCQYEGMVLGNIKERVLLNDISRAEKFLAWLHKELPSFPQDP